MFCVLCDALNRERIGRNQCQIGSLSDKFSIILPFPFVSIDKASSLHPLKSLSGPSKEKDEREKSPRILRLLFLSHFSPLPSIIIVDFAHRAPDGGRLNCSQMRPFCVESFEIVNFRREFKFELYRVFRGHTSSHSREGRRSGWAAASTDGTRAYPSHPLQKLIYYLYLFRTRKTHEKINESWSSPVIRCVKRIRNC